MCAKKTKSTRKPDHAGKPDTPTLPAISYADNQHSRTHTVTLEWPLMVDGERLEKIQIRRLTGKEVMDFQASMGNTDYSIQALAAQFVDQPQEVINALDMDDFFAVERAVIDFLPKSIRAAMELDRDTSHEQDPSSETLPMPSDGGEESS